MRVVTMCFLPSAYSAPVTSFQLCSLTLLLPGSRIPHQLCLIATGFKTKSSLNHVKSQVVPPSLFPLRSVMVGGGQGWEGAVNVAIQ